MTPGPRIALGLGLVTLATALLAGCGGAHHDEGTTSAQSAPIEGFDDQDFLAGCQEGCGVEDPLCARFCSCSLTEIHASPELARAVVDAGAEGADPAALEAIQVHFVSACGEEFYAHHFVDGCTRSCTDDGIASEICADRCACLYASLRSRHEGRDGLAYLTRVYGSDELPPEAQAEIEVVRPACGF